MKDTEAKASEIEPRLIMGLEKFNANYYIDKGIYLLAILEKISVFRYTVQNRSYIPFFFKKQFFWAAWGFKFTFLTE